MSNLLTKGAAVVGKLLAKGIITAPDITTLSATFTVGTEATDVINVAVQLYDGAGVAVAVRKALPWYLSTASAGQTPAASAPNAGTASGTNGKIIEAVAEKYGLMVFDASGRCDVNITDSGTPTFYLVVVMPNGNLSVSGAITFA